MSPLLPWVQLVTGHPGAFYLGHTNVGAAHSPPPSPLSSLSPPPFLLPPPPLPLLPPLPSPSSPLLSPTSLSSSSFLPWAFVTVHLPSTLPSHSQRTLFLSFMAPPKLQNCILLCKYLS